MLSINKRLLVYHGQRLLFLLHPQFIKPPKQKIVKRMKHQANLCMALNVAPLRESKKSLLKGMVKLYGEEAKRNFHATAQRRNVKDSTPQLRQTFKGLASPNLDFSTHIRRSLRLGGFPGEWLHSKLLINPPRSPFCKGGGTAHPKPYRKEASH